MRKINFVLMFFLCSSVHGQSYEVERLILDIEKLTQLKSMLSDLYKGYEILNSGYSAIKNISEGNFNLHQAFLDGLLAVSPAVRQYQHVADILNNQLMIISEYKTAFNRFKQDKHFNPDEITYLSGVYNNLASGSLKNVSALLTILTAGSLRMNDDERLHAIDKINTDTKDKLMFLRQFNNSTTMLALQRAAQQNDIGTLKQLYGLNQ